MYFLMAYTLCEFFTDCLKVLTNLKPILQPLFCLHYRHRYHFSLLSTSFEERLSSSLNCALVLSERVAHFKKLRGGLVFIDQIPKSQSGKILRRQLVELYKNQTKSKL